MSLSVRSELLGGENDTITLKRALLKPLVMIMESLCGDILEVQKGLMPLAQKLMHDHSELTKLLSVLKQVEMRGSSSSSSR